LRLGLALTPAPRRGLIPARQLAELGVGPARLRQRLLGDGRQRRALWPSHSAMAP
jgi:hypothetical protein